MTDLPIVMGPEGRVNTPPATLRADLVAKVAAAVPGYTADLPASLIEDIASTDVGALVVCDQALTDLINSLTPLGANLFLLAAQGQLAGVVQNEITNTSVFVIFSGPAGFLVGKGFTVSDGSHQYVVQDGGTISSGGYTLPLYCLATVTGVWTVPANTVTQIVTPPPSTIFLTCSNPQPGTPSGGEQTEEAYRAQIIAAYGRSAAQGMPTLLRTLLGNVTGVQERLIAIQQKVGGGWKIIVGGGDPYIVAGAIFQAIFDVSILVGSTDPSRNITVTINNFPDSYQIIYVNPPQQTVAISLLWGTNSPNYVSDAAVALAGGPALVAYVNSVAAGEPMNLFRLQDAFQDAVANIIPREFLTRMVFTVSIDGTPVPPDTGTGIIAGDDEGYFLANVGDVTIARG